MSSENSFPGKAGHVLSGTWIVLHTRPTHPPSHRATHHMHSPSTYRRESRRSSMLMGRAKQKPPASLTFGWLGWVSTKLSSPMDQPLPGSSVSSGRWESGSCSFKAERPCPLPHFLFQATYQNLDSCPLKAAQRRLKKVRKSTWVKEKKS